MAFKKFLLAFLAISLVVATSCSKFSKLQKSGTEQEKYAGALKYYEEEEYYKAGLLLEEIIPLLKGADESELAQFYQAYCEFHQGNYPMSQFLFKKFFETFARSERAEEAAYMYAFSLYKDSAPAGLDQASTQSAISALQDFLNTYPESEFGKNCAKYIIELRQKLELKAYEKVKLYAQISDFQLPSLKSAVISVDNFRNDFPDSKFNEELGYLKIDAQYKLAKNSLLNKQKGRYGEVLDFYHQFVDKYPESKFNKSAEKLYANSQDQLKAIADFEKERGRAIVDSDSTVAPAKLSAPAVEQEIE